MTDIQAAIHQDPANARAVLLYGQFLAQGGKAADAKAQYCKAAALGFAPAEALCQDGVVSNENTGAMISTLLGLLMLQWTSLALAKTYPPTVAVLYFDYTGKDENLAVLKKGLAQMLITDLESRTDACAFVERDRLEDILAELKLGQSNKVDKDTAAKVGKLWERDTSSWVPSLT